MPELKMPALSPTMEKGTLAKWLVGVGDTIRAGDLIAEIETDKATMELEADEEGRVASLEVPEGTDGVPVGTVIALLAGEDEAVEAPASLEKQLKEPALEKVPDSETTGAYQPPKPASIAAPRARLSDRIKISPLAARIAAAKSIVLHGISGSGPNGRIVRADLGLPVPVVTPVPAGVSTAPAPVGHPLPDVPHELLKLSNMRKTIARRLTESKQQIPHIYLSVDVRLDALLELRGQLNEALAPRGLKLSVNDLVIKALALSLLDVPQCNVQFTGDSIAQFQRADISVAVSIPGGLITPIIADAGGKTLSVIASEMKDLAARARDGKLRPEEYQGGTASLSNLGMYGIRQFEAVINPPQAMIMAVGAGERRHVVNDDDTTTVATVMTATGSFDHRAIDGVDAAQLMQAFKRLIENPLEMIA